MDEEEKKEMFNQYIQDVEWLRRSVSPDDIYEQALIAATFFLTKWSEWVDITEESNKDSVTESWVRNIIGIRIMRDSGHEGPIEFELRNPEEL